MLYLWHEAHHAALAPLRIAAETTQHMFRAPWVPWSYTHYGRTVAAACEVLERTTRRYRKPVFGLDVTRIDGEDVAVSEVTALETPFCRLLHFRRDTDREDPRVLVVAPLSGHYATLLRDTVAALLPEHDVFITEWADARTVPIARGSFDLDDYIDCVLDFLRVLGPDVHVVAVCQPSPPVLAAVSLMAGADDPAQPRSMILMGGPVDTRQSPTVVNRLAERHSLKWFERSVIATVPFPYPGFMRRVYPGFMQLTGFMTMNMDRHVDAHVKMFHHLVRGDGDSAAAHRRFYDEYLSVMDLPAEFYLQTIRTVFQEHALPRGVMTSRGRAVEPRAITRTALMTVEGELDDISGLGQTRAAQDLCRGIPAERRRHHQQAGIGHFGIFNGRRWRQSVMPEIRSFIRASA